MLLPTALVLATVCIVALAIGVEAETRRTAALLARVPVIGPILVTDCHECDAPTIRARAEEMPVVFPGGQEPDDALTIHFCEACSLRMTLDDRLELLFAEARTRYQEHTADGDLEGCGTGEVESNGD